MTPTELYEEVAGQFPAIWPQRPTWKWLNVHDGKGPKVDAISALIEQHIESAEVIVLVHATPGIGCKMAKAQAADYVAEFLCKHEIQVADPLFTRFVSFGDTGVATGDAQPFAAADQAPVAPARRASTLGIA